MSTYNPKSLVQVTDAIESILNQTYSNIEYIIIDGNSTDGTVDIIKKYMNKISYWVSEPDNGIYDAMNKGLEIATGEYVQFLNSSDTLYTNKTIHQIIDQIPINLPDVIYGNLIIDKEFEQVYMKPAPLDNFIYRFPIYHPSTIVKTNIMKKHKFNESFKIAADYDFFRKIYYQKASFYYIPIIFSIFEGINGISSTNSQMLSLEKERIFAIKYNSIKYYNNIIKYKCNLLIDKLKFHFFKAFSKKENIIEHTDNRVIKIVAK